MTWEANPAAVKGSTEEETTGEVYAIENPETTFPFLDEYEGEEYRREMVEVRLEDGTLLLAWMYWYTGSVNDEQRIWGNDYLMYLKNNKDRFL